MGRPRALKVDPERWRVDMAYRRDKMNEARKWAREVRGVVRIVLDDKNREVRATFDARFF